MCNFREFVSRKNKVAVNPYRNSEVFRYKKIKEKLLRISNELKKSRN
jgi:hypothetical protein